MRLVNCSKPNGKLLLIDTPLTVRGKVFQTYRKELDDGDCDYYEHNQTDNLWMKLVPEVNAKREATP